MKACADSTYAHNTMKNIVFFDLETRRSAAQVGGWDKAGLMGMSVGVTYSSRDQVYRIYTEDQVADLIAEMKAADLVVGFNHIGFDYEVIQPSSFWSIADMTTNLDMCLDLGEKLGHRLSLDSVAKASLGGLSKTAKGTDALKWWAEYEKNGDAQKLLDIATYCCYDVKVTLEVFQYGVEHGYVLYESKSGEVTQIPVDWASLC